MKLGDSVRIVSCSHDALSWPADLVGDSGVIVEDDPEELEGAESEDGVWRVLVNGVGWYIHEDDLEAMP